jgi:acyl-CoA reductase-like NAD-dependent aldehyde dehydrogenase
MGETARFVGTSVFVLFSCTLYVRAQVTPPVVTHTGRQPRVEPCWQQVGISKSAMEERAAIQRETHAQVEAVCANSSLTPQQRQQQIRQIRQEAKQRMEALVSPAQQESLRACQQERAAAHPPATGGLHHGGGSGPCGELPSTHPTGQPGQPPNSKAPAEEDTSPQN